MKETPSHLLSPHSAPYRTVMASSGYSNMPHIQLPTGTRLYYQFWAAGQPIGFIENTRPVIVLLHACLSDSTQWNRQIQDPRLGGYIIVTFDSKFHGKSAGQLKQGFSYRDGATDIAAAMDLLRVPAAHFVGESCEWARSGASPRLTINNRWRTQNHPSRNRSS